MDYLKVNKNAWNKKVDAHLVGSFYDMDRFMQGKSSLKDIELPFLKDIKGKSVLHLQCHFGQDTLSLERLGAKVTGVDLSDNAIDNARRIRDELGLKAKFICCDIFDLPNHLDETFDYVFTSYGTIIWLPDINKWGSIISRYLKPGGDFIFVDFHPVVWMFDDDFKKIAYKYDDLKPIVETESGTYGNDELKLDTEMVTWNHGLSNVIMALVRNGLDIIDLKEYDYSPWNCFNKTIEVEPDHFRIEHLDDKIPMVYSIHARKQ